MFLLEHLNFILLKHLYRVTSPGYNSNSNKHERKCQHVAVLSNYCNIISLLLSIHGSGHTHLQTTRLLGICSRCLSICDCTALNVASCRPRTCFLLVAVYTVALTLTFGQLLFGERDCHTGTMMIVCVQRILMDILRIMSQQYKLSFNSVLLRRRVRGALGSLRTEMRCLK